MKYAIRPNGPMLNLNSINQKKLNAASVKSVMKTIFFVKVVQLYHADIASI